MPVQVRVYLGKKPIEEATPEELAALRKRVWQAANALAVAELERLVDEQLEAAAEQAGR